MTDLPPVPDEASPKAAYRLAVFWKEDPRTKKTFSQYREVQVKRPRAKGEAEDRYEFYPLLLSERLEALILQWNGIQTLDKALKAKKEALVEAKELFDEAIEASDNPHCETFVAQTAMNHLTTVELIFNLIFFANELPLFFDQAMIAKVQQTGTLYLWLDPYLSGLSQRTHRPLDTEEVDWPAKEEVYCYFKRKSELTVSPQQLANLWRTNASRIVEIDEECRQMLWEWLKGRQFSEDEIRALILP